MDTKSGLEELERRRKIDVGSWGPERIDRLLDPGTFRETGLLEQYEMREGSQREWPTGF